VVGARAQVNDTSKGAYGACGHDSQARRVAEGGGSALGATWLGGGVCLKALVCAAGEGAPRQ
jgi:hypothetical protein